MLIKKKIVNVHGEDVLKYASTKSGLQNCHPAILMLKTTTPTVFSEVVDLLILLTTRTPTNKIIYVFTY